MFKEKISKIIKWTIKHFKASVTFYLCIGFVVTFSLVFVSGTISSETKDEICADYYKNIALNYTVDTENKKLSGLIVEPKVGHDVTMASDTFTEINNIWGAFKGENASFAPVINANKEVDIHFVDNDYSNENISILYSSLGGSTAPYHTIKVIDEKTKETKEVPIDYKFQCSPLATMFSSGSSGPQSELRIYISQKQAENKLKAMHIETIDLDALHSLIGKETDVVFDGELRTCVIDNIFLDNFSHDYTFPYINHKYNYYYGTDVGTILGDFIFISTAGLYPSTLFPKNLVKQGMYFMSEYSYRNRFYLEYAKQCYSPVDYSFNYVTSNLKEGFIPDDSILQTAVSVNNSNVGCALITTLFSLMFVAGLALIFIFKLYMSPLSLILIGASAVLPYLVFKVIYILTKSVVIFSSYSTVLNMILLIVLAVAVFTFIVCSKTINRRENIDA